ncbi:MAG: hypothetical protein IJM83_01535 [Firmicutes bacterium]|nr:hypothetical protein [Bacillota bacterium]
MLFKPKYYNKNESKAAEAVKKISDPEKLRSIVRDGRITWYARLTAAKQLEDDEMLIWLEKNSSDSLTRRRASDVLIERKKKREEEQQLALLEKTDDLGTVMDMYLRNPVGYNHLVQGSYKVRNLAIARMKEFSEEEYFRFIIDTPIGRTTRHELAMEQISSDELLDKIADAELRFEIEDPKDEFDERTLRIAKRSAEKLQKEARKKAEENRHNSICNGRHDWEWVGSEDRALGEGGDFQLVYKTRRCRRCGETKSEYFWPNGTPFIKTRT